MRVFEAFAEVFVRERISTVFAVMGDANMKFLAELAARGAEIHYARHEGSAIAMAEGYARATGELGVCSVTCGPGVSLLTTTLVIASRSRTPLLVFAGDAPLSDKHYIQGVDQRRLVAAAEAIPQALRGPESAAADLRDALYLARSGGPVVFSAPFDVQEVEVGDALAGYVPSTGLLAPAEEPPPDGTAVRRAAAIISGAERPIVVAGRGALDARGEIEALADATGALLSTTFLAKGLFHGHPSELGIAGAFATRSGRERFAAADCVVAIGASLSSFTTDAGRLFPDARVVRIDKEPAGLINGRQGGPPSAGGTGPAACHVRGGARATARALVEALQPLGRNGAGAGAGGSWTRVAPEPEPDPAEATDGGVHPALAINELSAAAAPDSTFVIGLGHYCWFPVAYLRGRGPEAYRMTTEFGTIGQGLTSAIGAAVGRPDRRHVLVEGDASVMMAVQELDSAVRFGIDLLVVVMNDRGLGAEAHKLRALGYDPSPALLPMPDLAALARSMGADGIEVTRAQDIGPAVRRFQAEGGVRLIDVRVSQSVMSDPYHHKLGAAGRDAAAPAAAYAIRSATA
jgi:thiamine pyrophosphate-dependent acetolactate synthase large subunit-like protein